MSLDPYDDILADLNRLESLLLQREAIAGQLAVYEQKAAKALAKIEMLKALIKIEEDGDGN